MGWFKVAPASSLASESRRQALAYVSYFLTVVLNHGF
jgi:hypothetical protein